MSVASSSLSSVRVKGFCHPVAPPLPADVVDERARLYRALGDATRLQMLHMLAAATDPICVCDFTAAFELEQPTISHHLAKLRDAGLITSFKQGIWAFYALRTDLSGAARRAIDDLR